MREPLDIAVLLPQGEPKFGRTILQSPGLPLSQGASPRGLSRIQKSRRLEDPKTPVHITRNFDTHPWLLVAGDVSPELGRLGLAIVQGIGPRRHLFAVSFAIQMLLSAGLIANLANVRIWPVWIVRQNAVANEDVIRGPCSSFPPIKKRVLVISAKCLSPSNKLEPRT